MPESSGRTCDAEILSISRKDQDAVIDKKRKAPPIRNEIPKGREIRASDVKYDFGSPCLLI